MTDRLTASDREALVARVRKCADELYGLPGEGQLLRLSPRNAERVAVDLRALCAEVERLTRERDVAVADEKLAVSNADRMTDEVVALTAEVERLREDAERIDWLERNGGVEFYSKPGSSGWRSWSEFDRHTLRAAIDAARTTGRRDA